MFVVEPMTQKPAFAKAIAGSANKTPKCQLVNLSTRGLTCVRLYVRDWQHIYTSHLCIDLLVVHH